MKLTHLSSVIYSEIEKRSIEEDLVEFQQQLLVKEGGRTRVIEQIAEIGSWEMILSSSEKLEDQSLVWSDQVFEICGYQPNEIEPTVGLFYKHIVSEDMELLNEAISMGMESKKSFDVVHRICTLSGQIKTVHQRGEFIYNQAGDWIGVMGIIQNLTEERNRVAGLETARANLKNILENTDTGYILLDEHCQIVSFNDRAGVMVKTGYGKCLQVGHNYFDMLQEDRKPYIRSLINKMINTKEPVGYEMSYEEEGQEHWFKIRIRPILGVKDEFLGLTIASDDITEQKQAQLEKESLTARLIQRNQALEQFAYIISHNVRAPLANILGLTNLLPVLGTEIDNYLDGLKESASKLDQVVTDLNRMLEIHKPCMYPQEQIKLTEIHEAVCNSLQNDNEDFDIDIRTDFSEVGSLISIKPYIKNIFYQLIHNSFRYLRKGVEPMLEIKSMDLGERIGLQFTDNGIGIDLDMYGDQMFGFYKRFHQEVEGKGLGLYTVHSQVKSMRGNIVVKSIPDQGSSFIITLPKT
ncbi:PAS domain S-box protein [Reichenbachiella sp. 5M10]|uniref:sensor histidine kinase n=1 Tax=Reichenbachiella sp. 5M10 TaxID=1889772 RepID=UPI001304086F|nr:PAS domain S-box protein [Reichenbachiella sp. 5M10]